MWDKMPQTACAGQLLASLVSAFKGVVAPEAYLCGSTAQTPAHAVSMRKSNPHDVDPRFASLPA